MIKVDTYITNAMVANLLAAAFSGFCSYWLKETRCEINGDSIPTTNRTTLPLTDDGKVICVLHMEPDKNAGREFTLDKLAIERGLLIMRDKYPNQFARIFTGKDDAETGDVFIQSCLFGEVVFA